MNPITALAIAGPLIAKYKPEIALALLAGYHLVNGSPSAVVIEDLLTAAEELGLPVGPLGALLGASADPVAAETPAS